MKQWTDEYILETQKVQIGIYSIFVELAVLIYDRACKYGLASLVVACSVMKMIFMLV